MRGFTFDYTPSDKFDRPDEEVARNGSAYDRSTLARHENLSREMFLILADTDEYDVYSSLAMNYTTPPDILDRAVERFPELREWAATNPNASADLMRTAPLAEHIAQSIVNFLNQVEATDAERRELMKRYYKLTPPGGPLLGDVWADIRLE
ncbi:hypothetical protein ARGLB_028_00090 [Arthrobacter globiformis NBRC 12137]|uniref:Uncharacterized protein n=2 Tax=Arthrobacter globiformis TaxID=1665 RepID=H0QJ83_ARTG1|nr:hypothetical protein ARGLB_028_00090 [Arthrobacter globiformis NBRC 12137]